MAKPEKSASEATEDTPKPKNKKKLLLIMIGVLVLAAAGGAGWYFTKGSHPAEPAKAAPPAPPKFIPLEPLTVNLQHEGGEQFLQIGITLKFTAPELEEKIKLHMPEIRSRLLLLLSSKHATELSPPAGKQKLMQEIVAEASSVLGLRVAPVPKPAATETHTASGVGAASEVATASGVETASAAEAATAEAEAVPAEHGEADSPAPAPLEVLFTSFIIQ